MLPNTSFEIITSALSAAIIAQLIKLIICLIKKQKINFEIFVQMGGMPSSISAFIVAIATSIELISGYRSIEFAIAMGYTLIIMYDAAGLRRSASKIGSALNKIVDDYYGDKSNKYHSEKIFEVLGHTPFEVLVGGVLGLTISMYYHYLLLR